MNVMDDWTNAMIISGKSDRTIRAYLWHVQKTLDYCGKPHHEITTGDLLAFLAAQKERAWGVAAIKMAVCALRSFFAFTRGKESPAKALPIVRPKLRRQRTLTAAQAFGVMASCATNTVKGIRDLALLCLMLDTGLRSFEICKLKIDEVNLKERTLFTVVKGGKEGEGVFTEYTAAQLGMWLEVRKQVAVPNVPELFVGIGGLKPGTRITHHGLRCIFRGLAKAAGLSKLSPHDLRRTFATLCIRNGAPTRLVQVAGRWDSLELLEQYTAALQPSDIDRYLPVNHLMGVVGP